jgi:hypothetical protein
MTCILNPMRSSIRLLAACCVVTTGWMSFIKMPATASAEPVATTALVSKIVDGDKVAIVDDDRGSLMFSD